MAIILIYNTLLSFILSAILLAVSLSAFSLVKADNDGLSVELIHRDSPNSPFFNPSKTPYQHLTHSLQRSTHRVNRFNLVLTSSKATQSALISGAGDYLMKISIGTPPVDIFATADTGSNLIWTQCKSCIKCYNQSNPFFNPNASSTYKQVLCNESQCKSLIVYGCQSSVCYYLGYFEDGMSAGILATDTVTLASTSGQLVSLPDTTIGCGINNEFDIYTMGSGIVGLGPGANSLVSRMGNGNSFGVKFSYCLVPSFSNLPSQLNFGSNGVVAGPDVVSTPLLLEYPYTFYFLTLEAISVDGERLEFHNRASYVPLKGNTLIDSGSTLTYLPGDFYRQLESKVNSMIHLERAQQSGQQLSLCYKTESDISSPIITMHFTGADVKLSPLNTFLRITKDVVCLAFAPNEYASTVTYGNWQQMNFLIGYDLERRMVSFKQTDCSRY